MGDEKLLENDVVSGSAENLDTVLMDYMDDDMTDENADPFNPVIDENDPKYIEAMQFAENYQPSDDDYPAEGYFEDDYFDGFSDNEVSVKNSLSKWMSFSGKIQMAYLTMILR